MQEFGSVIQAWFSNHSREFRAMVGCHQTVTLAMANGGDPQTKREE
jgi:hypothetical protein